MGFKFHVFVTPAHTVRRMYTLSGVHEYRNTYIQTQVNMILHMHAYRLPSQCNVFIDVQRAERRRSSL